MPWNSAQAIVTSASYCGDELQKPVYSRLFPSFFPTPRRVRRPSHLNLFLLGLRPKLIVLFFLSEHRAGSTGRREAEAGQGRADQGGQGRAGQFCPPGTDWKTLGPCFLLVGRDQYWSRKDRVRVRRRYYGSHGCGESGERTVCVMEVETLSAAHPRRS